MYVKIKTTAGNVVYVNGDSVSYIEEQCVGSDEQFTNIALRDDETVATSMPIREVVRLFNDGVYCEED